MKRTVRDVDINALAANFVEALDLYPSGAVTAAHQGIAHQRAYQELASLFTDTGHQSLLAQAQWWLRAWLEEKADRANTMAATIVAELGGVEAPAGIVLLAEAVAVKAGQLLSISQGALNFRENKAYYIAACSADAADFTEHDVLPLECNLRVTGASNPFNGEGDIRLYHPHALATTGGPLLQANVPLMLKTLPTPVSIMQQQAMASAGDVAADAAAKVLESRLWDYRITYDRQSAVQDTLIVQFDTGSNTFKSSMTAPSSPDLFDTLVEFSNIYPQLRIDLEQENPIAEARESFEWLVMNVCNAWMYRMQTMKLKQQLSYRIVETEDEDGTLRVNITGAQAQGGRQLLLRYEGYTAERTGEDWRFLSDDTQQYLSFADRNWHLRNLLFEKLDIFKIESARAELAIERNLLPVDGKIPNPDFAMRTGFVGPYAPAAPFLETMDAIDITAFGQTSAKRLEGFFTRLFDDTTDRWLRLTVSYVYEVMPGGGMPVTTRVLLLPQEVYTQGLAASLATTIDDWTRRHLSPEPKSGEFFELDITVFGMSEHRGILRVKAGMPVLRTT